MQNIKKLRVANRGIKWLSTCLLCASLAMLVGTYYFQVHNLDKWALFLFFIGVFVSTQYWAQIVLLIDRPVHSIADAMTIIPEYSKPGMSWFGLRIGLAGRRRKNHYEDIFNQQESKTLSTAFAIEFGKTTSRNTLGFLVYVLIPMLTYGVDGYCFEWLYVRSVFIHDLLYFSALVGIGLFFWSFWFQSLTAFFLVHRWLAT